MRKLIYLLIVFLFTSCTQANAQINPDKISIFTNYNGIRIPNGFNETYEEGIAWNIGLELQTTDNTSVVLYVYDDFDGYEQLRVPVFGAPLAFYDSRVPFSTRYTEYFVMGRLYTESNYTSLHPSLRTKDLYGLYFSYGFSMQSFTGNYWSLGEQFWDERPDGTEFLNNYVDRSIAKITDKSMQFGFGMKNFHTKYVYSDVMFLSSAYRRDYRKVNTTYVGDPRREANNDPWEVDDEVNLERVNVWARNGRGILLLINIGINLDPR